jgi:hypothetical protein
MSRNNMHFSMLTLNVSGLNASTKRHRIANKTQAYTAYKRLISPKKINTGLKVKEWKKVFQAIGSQNRKE